MSGIGSNQPRMRGIYINLDRAVDRRRRIEGDLDRLGLTQIYRRLAATDAATIVPAGQPINAAMIGCFHSHVRALELAASADGLVHIMEDDSVPTRYVVPFMDWIASLGTMDAFDAVFLEMWVDPDERLVRALHDVRTQASPPAGQPFAVERTRLVAMRQLRVGSAASYVVSPAGAARLLGPLRQELAGGPFLPFDSFLHRLVQQGQARAALTVPFLTVTDLADGSSSGLQPIAPDYNKLLLLLRNSFFADRDRGALLERLGQLGHLQTSDPTYDFVGAMIRL